MAHGRILRTGPIENQVLGHQRLLAELEEFVGLHRRHGDLHADTSEPAAHGYRLFVTCRCGVTFERWITPEDAAVDLALLARWN